jgi:2-polyprenyl-3-methyl-5-hydroxy-6-metoxy-1,4-benzoquinol methylase
MLKPSQAASNLLQTLQFGSFFHNSAGWLNRIIDQLPLHSDIWGEHFLDYQRYGIQTPPLVMQLGSGAIVPYPRHLFAGDCLLPGEQLIARLAVGRILEIGAGWGRVSAVLRAMGKSVVTTDASDGAVELYKRRGWKNIEKLVLPESIGGPYNTVICLGNVISLIPGWRLILQAITSIHVGLAEGGYVFISNADIPWLDAVLYTTSSTDVEPFQFRRRFIYQYRRGPWEIFTPTSLGVLGWLLHTVGFRLHGVFFAEHEANSRYYLLAQKT